ncbi:hypothetical protein NKG94_50650 [Micromonospora sp. M12]
MNKDTGAVSYVAGGLRTPHGIGWGPENGIFVTDNQGGWQPASKLVHIKQGRFFNHYLNPAGPFDNAPVTQPVLWMPQNEIGNSPSTPLLMPSGTYAGQFVIGDVTYGGLQRASSRRSTVSTRVRCSVSPRAWRPVSRRSTADRTAPSTSAGSGPAVTGASPAS